MFYRKVLLIALLAVVLLGSFVEGQSFVKPHTRKRRVMVEPSISAVAPAMRPASDTNLMDQLAFREKRGRRKPRVSLMNPVAVDTGMKITADRNEPCPNCADMKDQLVFRSKTIKHRRKV